MAVEAPGQTITRLLTLLNVSATKNTKRKRWTDDAEPTTRLNKRKGVRIAEVEETGANETPNDPPPETASTMRDESEINEGERLEVEAEGAESGEEEEGEPHQVFSNSFASDYCYLASTSYLQVHFGAETKLLSETARKCVDERDWTVTHHKSKMGMLAQYQPSNVGQDGNDLGSLSVRY